MEKNLQNNQTVTEEMLAHPLNSNVTLKAGLYAGDGSDTCTSPKPTVGAGEYGEYICVSGEWVFKEFVG